MLTKMFLASILVVGLVIDPLPATAGDGGAAIRTALAGHTLENSSGASLTAEDLKGEIVVVNFWATWCKPCRKEMPLLQELHTRLSENRGRVLAISVDRKAERVERFVADMGLTLPVYVDGPDGLAKELELKHLPYTVVLDRAGQVAFAGAGGPGKAWDSMMDVVDRLLATPPVSVRARVGR